MLQKDEDRTDNMVSFWEENSQCIHGHSNLCDHLLPLQSQWARHTQLVQHMQDLPCRMLHANPMLASALLSTGLRAQQGNVVVGVKGHN